MRFLQSKTFFSFLVLLFLADICYTFKQHYSATLDGDLASLVVPSQAYQHVLSDPFGLDILKTGQDHAASNRYFVQWFTYAYFRTAPFCLQSFLSPIDSVYAAAALLKTFTQIGLLFILAAYICITFGWGKKEFVLSMVLICPFFQLTGYSEHLGIVDYCISYAIAYALPLFFLLLFLYPFYKAAMTGHSGLSNPLKIVWLFYPVILCFSGPIINPVLLIVCPSVLAFIFFNSWASASGNIGFYNRSKAALGAIPKELLVSFSSVFLIGLYSFYIGTHNIENQWTPMPLTERYLRLLEGIVKILLSMKEGVFPILLMVLGNLVVLQLLQVKDMEKLKRILFLMALFAAVYIVLLPLGGYRSYRPYILRRDTLLPVHSVLFFAWGLTTILILQQLQRHRTAQFFFGSLIFLMLAVYTLADRQPEYNNACERAAMLHLSRSETDCVELNENCTVMQWGPTQNCEETRLIAKVLHLWNITPRETSFKQK